MEVFYAAARAARVASVADGMAAVDTPMGRLVGRNTKGLGVGAEAILFVVAVGLEDIHDLSLGLDLLELKHGCINDQL